MDQQSIKQLRKEQSAAIRTARKEVKEWQTELKKAVRSWRDSVVWRLNARKYAIEDEIAAFKTQNEEVEDYGTEDVARESPDGANLLELRDRVGDEAKTDNNSGRKRRSKHEGTK